MKFQMNLKNLIKKQINKSIKIWTKLIKLFKITKLKEFKVWENKLFKI